jgi:AcrR family transcriptional regulator
MRERKDGVETRRRILDAACSVFSEKGFRDATVAEICDRAGANTASVNYHFRDKETLYVDVWKRLAEEADHLHPIDGGVPPNAPAHERLGGLVRSLVRRMTDRGRLGAFHRLHTMERVNPTGLLDEVMHEIHWPLRQRLLGAIREILGPDASEEDVLRCEMSVIGQCRMMCREGRRRMSPPPVRFADDSDVEQLAQHITRFSLGGIQGVRRHIDGIGVLDEGRAIEG